ncbi:MAG: Hpt domain-containing protein, partial [Burkholderiales bacterium]|nr:Hpt domain-containing protein [Burkholderiales bacterium]
MSVTDNAINYGAIRLRFEKLLLTVLTNKNPAAQHEAAEQMSALIREIEQAQTSSQAKAFWLVMRAFAESCSQVDQRDERHVKQIWGRINLQIRRLVEGNTSVPERLLRDALFFIAQVKQPSSFVSQIRKAYQLENHVPEDYDQRRYGLITPQVLTSAKEQLSSVKNLWGRVANGDASSAEKFTLKVKELAETGQALQTPPLAKLLKELNGMAGHAVRTKDKERMGIELATCLLFIENALEQITHLPANFSARADEITSRLLSVVGGEAPGNQASWIGEISREAQQRQTMGVLVGEMQLSLKQAEKALDEHFRDPSNTAILAPVDGVLAQLGGALAILDQDDALAAVNHTRSLVNKFNVEHEGKPGADVGDLFNQVAQNIGALSFFIETLQSQPEFAKKRFVFDSETGSFQTMVQQQKESERLFASLVEAPQDSQLQAQLKDSLDNERSYAALLDDSEASARAKTAIDLLAHTDFEHASESLEEIVAATSHVEHATEVSAPLDLPETEAEIDAELLEIFLTEADEVLDAVSENIPLSRHEPQNQEYLIRLRRSFHTLKGSGRMVGLNVFGEGAWNIEQVMNLWLSETKDGTEALYQLLDYASSEMREWVDELKTRGASNRNADAMIAAAIAVKEGGPFELKSPEPTVTAIEPDTQVLETAILPETTDAHADAELIAPISFESAQVEVAEEALPVLTLAEELDPAVEDVPEFATEVAADFAADIGAEDSTELAPALEFETLSESSQSPVIDAAIEVTALPVLEEDFALEISEPEVLQTAISEAALSLPVDEPTQADPYASDVVAEEHIEVVALEQASDEELPMLDDVMGHIAAEADLPVPAVHVIDAEELAEVALPIAQDSQEAIVDSIDAIEATEPDHMPQTVASEELPEEVVIPVLEESVDQLAAPEETLSPSTKTAQIIEFPDFTLPASKESDNTKRIGEIEISLPLHTIYMAETDEIVRFLAQDFSEWRHEPGRQVSRHAVHASHSLAGSSATVGLYAAQELAHSLENVLQRLERHPVEMTVTEFDLLDHIVDCIKAMLQQFALSEMAERATSENLQLAQLLESIIARSNAGDDEEFITSTNERLDSALLDDSEEVHGDAVVPELDSLDVAAVEVESEPESAALISAEVIELSPVEDVLAPQMQEATVAENDDSVATGDIELKVSDEIDFDLLPVFLEEGGDLLPMIGSLLRSWQQNPQDDAIPQSILRLMHTVKGSARMAGAMQLGQHTHDMETRIENLMHTGSTIRQPLLEDLLSRHDYAMHLFERLQNPDLAMQQAPQASSSELTATEEMNQYEEGLVESSASLELAASLADDSAASEWAGAAVESTLTTVESSVATEVTSS